METWHLKGTSFEGDQFRTRLRALLSSAKESIQLCYFRFSDQNLLAHLEMFARQKPEVDIDMIVSLDTNIQQSRRVMAMYERIAEQGAYIR